MAGDEAKLVSTIKEDRASPFSDNLMHGLNRKWEEGHGSSQRDHTWSNQRGYLTEEVQVHFEFNRIKGNIDDLESSYTGRPIDAITGVTSDGLRHAHDHVSRLGKGSIHGQIADHAGHQAMVGITCLEDLFQQFDAQCLDLIDVLCSGKPAVRCANMALGSPNPNFRGQQCPDSWTRRSLGCQQVQTAFSPPFLIACNGSKNSHLYILKGMTRI